MASHTQNIFVVPYDPTQDVSDFVRKYGESGRIVLHTFCKVDPLQNGGLPEEYLPYAASAIRGLRANRNNTDGMAPYNQCFTPSQLRNADDYALLDLALRTHDDLEKAGIRLGDV